LSDVVDLLIVGGGPAGLACAIAARQASLTHEVLEKGVLVNSVYEFPSNMTFFTTPELLEIGGLPFVTPYEKPTRGEALRYYRRVADTHQLNVSLGVQVVSLSARPGGGFEVGTVHNGVAQARPAHNVALATGYYDWPNRLGIPGEDLPHVSHYYTDAHAHYRKRVVIVGGKNSAVIAALETYRAGARSVTLVHRGDALSRSVKYWLKPDVENRIKEGAIAARFQACVREIRPTEVLVEGPQGREALEADDVLLLTGYRPDTTLLQQAGVRLDPGTLIPEHDPRTLETNVPGLFVGGALAAGNQTSRIFIENGRFHGEQIAAAIAARRPDRKPL
jgi:thioredoxin reductase (NADPH)